MAAKKTPAELVVTSPEWQVPSREQLEEIETGHVINHVRKYHEGLRTIRIEVLDAEKQTKGQIQKFELVVGDGGTPLLGADHVAQLIRARGIRYAVDEDRKTQFRVWLQGKSATTREWTQQLRFTIDPTITEDYQDAADDDDEDGDEYDDDEDGPDDEEVGGEPDDDGYQDDEREPAPVTRATRPVASPDPRAAAEPRFAPRPQPAHDDTRYVDADARATSLPPSHELHPSVAIARQQGIDVKPEHMQVQISPDFMLALMEAGEERMARMISPLMREMRLGMQTIRRESSRTAREARLTARMVARAAVDQQKQSQERQNQLEARFIKTHELNSASYENFQLIAQQGWTAFRNSMEKEAQTYVHMREYDRALLGQQLDQAHTSNRTSATGSALSYGAPIALAIGAGIMRKRGDAETADLLAELAKGFANSPEEDDEDEQGEEEVIDTQATAEAPPRSSSGTNGAPEAGQGNGTSNGASHRWEVSATPVILGSRAFLDSLSKVQVEQLQQILPKTAWDAMLGAANAQIEAAALASIAILKGIVSSDMALMMRVNGLLEPKQRNILLKLIQISSGAKPKGRGIPRRPQAAAG